MLYKYNSDINPRARIPINLGFELGQTLIVTRQKYYVQRSLHVHFHREATLTTF